MKRLSQFKSYVEEGQAAIFIGAGISKIDGCGGLVDISSFKSYLGENILLDCQCSDDDGLGRAIKELL